MKIVEVHSILGGLEHLLVHKRQLWEEIQEAVSLVDARRTARTRPTGGTDAERSPLLGPELGARLRHTLEERGWHPSQTTCLMNPDSGVILRRVRLPQKAQQAVGPAPIPVRYGTDLLRDRIAIEVEFGNGAFIASSLFAKHEAFYVADVIDVAVDILPTKLLADEMSAAEVCFERELDEVLKLGRGGFAVPLILVGVGT